MIDDTEYRVERINHYQRHLYADLFNQYKFCQRETSQEKSVTNRMVKRLFNSEPVLFIVLRNYPETIPVGFIQLYSICSSINDVQTTIVSDLYVLPDSRKNGIALKLIEAAVKFAINNKSGLIELETLQDNLIARKLFESVGFKSQTSESEVNLYSIQFEYD
jgi:ribosomal protein S18 acetylase RimI-like enzyme